VRVGRGVEREKVDAGQSEGKAPERGARAPLMAIPALFETRTAR
jgi:hypothetical protein